MATQEAESNGTEAPIDLKDMLSDLRIILILLMKVRPTIRRLRRTLAHESFRIPENIPNYHRYISIINRVLNNVKETPNLDNLSEEPEEEEGDRLIEF